MKHIPSLDHKADGFNAEGVTILIGGDHGDKNCPISVKLNLSSPIECKRKCMLGHQCPVIQFASVQCSKDVHELMDSTIMPTVKEQLMELESSGAVTVCHIRRPRETFRSCIVPSTIHWSTMKFTRNKAMTFAFGDEGHLSFGTIDLSWPLFDGIPHFELAVSIIISTFNQLFISNLAFLAMLIGMNNSSGNHCLICMLKGSEFNCPHVTQALRTKESLVQCLEECMVLAAAPRKDTSQLHGR
jgi:hypothetical protein